jgi:hypothetical protein
MGITKTDISRIFSDYDVTIEQEGSKQLFWVWLNTNDALLVSYMTVVGCVINGKVYLTKRKYSVTTSRQVNGIARQKYSSEFVEQDVLQKMVDDILALQVPVI